MNELPLYIQLYYILYTIIIEHLQLSILIKFIKYLYKSMNPISIMYNVVTFIPRTSISYINRLQRVQTLKQQ
jgi:hypothetical protein